MAGAGVICDGAFLAITVLRSALKENLFWPDAIRAMLATRIRSKQDREIAKTFFTALSLLEVGFLGIARRILPRNSPICASFRAKAVSIAAKIITREKSHVNR